MTKKMLHIVSGTKTYHKSHLTDHKTTEITEHQHNPILEEKVAAKDVQMVQPKSQTDQSPVTLTKAVHIKPHEDKAETGNKVTPLKSAKRAYNKKHNGKATSQKPKRGNNGNNKVNTTQHKAEAPKQAYRKANIAMTGIQKPKRASIKKKFVHHESEQHNTNAPESLKIHIKKQATLLAPDFNGNPAKKTVDHTLALPLSIFQWMSNPWLPFMYFASWFSNVGKK